MDIAEIRKKARAERKGSAEPPATATVEASRLHPPQPADEGTRAIIPDRELQDSAPLFDPVVIEGTVNSSVPQDGIEQLFSRANEISAVVSDAYGSTLMSDRERAEVEARRWLAFSLGSEEYSLDITSIREIIKPREITNIPRVPDFLLGIISLRGNIIPVFDLKRRLRLGVSSISNHSRIVVCQEGERYAGLLVDRITQVVSIPEESIEPPPAVLSGIDRDLVGGVGRFQGKMLILLQLSSVLNFELS